MKQGERLAEDELVRSHMRLVFAIANEFARRSQLQVDELVSEGLMGLVIAVRRYELVHGTRLANYAALWIRALLRRYTLANRRIVRAPGTRRGRRILANLTATERNVSRNNAGIATTDAIARELGVAERDIHEAQAALRAQDVAFEHEELPDTRDEASPELLVGEAEESQLRRAAFYAFFEQLEPREQQVLNNRKLSERPHSLRTLGRALGVSSERVRQIEQRSCQKLHAHLSVTNC
jgi:RNA polymerase sigma-32 factor